MSSWKSMASVTNFTASEAPWQNGLVERNDGTWRAAVRKAIKDVGAREFV